MEQVEKISTSQFITEQHGDPEVSSVFSRSISESEVSQNPTCYFTKNGVPMKMWRLPDIPTEEEWAVQYNAFLDQQAETPKARALLTDLCCPKEKAKPSAIRREQNSSL